MFSASLMLARGVGVHPHVLIFRRTPMFFSSGQWQ